MKMKKLFAIILSCLLLSSLLFGCGAASDGMTAENNNAVLKDEMEPGVQSGSITSTSQTNAPQVNPNQKLIRKVWLDAETEDLDTLLEGVAQKITELAGYVESRNVNNGSNYSSRRYRSADLTIRIPADKLDQFVQHVSESANLTNNKETADDITLKYVATQSRITALQTEETRLLELLGAAKNMSDLLEIEKRLTEVRTELEQVQSQLRVYENQVSYGTIYLSVEEVKEYTVTEEPETVWERISTGFVKSLKNVGEFFTELFVVIVVGLPYLVLIGVAVAVAVILVRLRKKKRQPKQKPNTEE
jgi:hypothetical protein